MVAEPCGHLMPQNPRQAEGGPATGLYQAKATDPEGTWAAAALRAREIKSGLQGSLGQLW